MVNRLVGIASRISMALEMGMDQQQLRLLGMALASAANAVMVTDHQGRIQWANAAFLRLSGYEEGEIIGQSPQILKSGQQDKAYYQALWRTINNGEVWSNETVEKNKDGSLYTVMQTITPLTDAAGRITHFIAIHEDITDQKHTRERISHMAQYDGLTDLPNRALFYDRLRQALSLARRGNVGLALMFLDLDRFKQVNDTLGHHIGDVLLKSVAERLRQCVRESDTVARLGGDEFTVLLYDLREREDIGRIAEKIIAAVSRPYELDGHDVRIGVSIGIARFTVDTEDEDKLMNLADKAMYAAKAEGRNTYRFCVD
jgi:diguanylate cyclase (GGDEF)-like protein/PAS domain S-box-containing protein